MLLICEPAHCRYGCFQRRKPRQRHGEIALRAAAILHQAAQDVDVASLIYCDAFHRIGLLPEGYLLWSVGIPCLRKFAGGGSCRLGRAAKLTIFRSPVDASRGASSFWVRWRMVSQLTENTLRIKGAV